MELGFPGPRAHTISLAMGPHHPGKRKTNKKTTINIPVRDRAKEDRKKHWQDLFVRRAATPFLASLCMHAHTALGQSLWLLQCH